MEIKQCYLTKNDCYQVGRQIKPVGIVVHSTGANNPNLRRYVQPDDGLLGKNVNHNDWNRSGLQVCVHAFIGKDQNGIVRIYQTLPWTYRCWGCGSGKFGSYNNSHIQFEICEDALTDQAYYQEAMWLAKMLCVYLCQKYNIRVIDVVSHREAHQQGYASNHGDCDHWLTKFGDTMHGFRTDIKRLMEEDAMKSQVEQTMLKIEKLKIIIDGQEEQVDGIFSNGVNYGSVRQLAEKLGYNVSAKGSTPVLKRR